MALTFKVSGLLEIIDGIAAAAAAEEQRYTTECIEARATYKRRWWADRKNQTRELRDHLTKCLKNDVAPTESEVRKIMGTQSTVSWFSEGGDGNVSKKALGYYRMDELRGLGALLKAHIGDTVTAHQLKELGIHARDLEKLFRAAVEAGASVKS